MRFYNLTVDNIEKTTSDCSVVSFDIGEDLKDIFAYKQGQYLTVKSIINGEEVRRSYSLCSSPLDKEWKIGVKKIQDGKFSTFVNDSLKKGDTLQVMPPNGRFFVEIDATKSKNYIAFAAGSGITPIFSIIKSHLVSEPNSTFKLFYINQNVQSIILKEEIEALKNTFFNRFEIFHFLTREQRSAPLFCGRITKEKLVVIFDKILDVETLDDVFICGPKQMIFMIKDFLVNKNMNPKQIHFELFGTAAAINIPTKKIKKKSDKVCDVTIIEGGKAFQFELPLDSDSILDAALNKSADLPFACKGGVCCTCKAKLIEGEVKMKVNYSLEQEEVDAGYILTCQAMPISEKVTVDFDV